MVSAMKESDQGNVLVAQEEATLDGGSKKVLSEAVKPERRAEQLVGQMP